MPHQTTDSKRALITSHLLLDFVGVIVRIVRVHRRSAEAYADALLMAAIFIGQSEHHPMTAYKLAQYSGIPRPTITRKLRELLAIGYVVMDDHGRASISPETVNSARFSATTREISRLVQKASTELSKLDG